MIPLSRLRAGQSQMRSKVPQHRHCAPSPACGGGLGWGCLHIGSLYLERAPTRRASRVDLPRKRER